MNRFVRAAAIALFVAACRGGGAPAPVPAALSSPVENGPNVLLITIDTLRSDHLGAYGYTRHTSPSIDGLAQRGALFTRAYAAWPKTRGSMAIMLTGRRPSQNGYSKHHPGIPGFNATLASVLQSAGYATTAFVDNPNVASLHGYSKGFAAYHETWEDKTLETEWARTQAITDGAIRALKEAGPAPFFLWLHYVNPHAPYEPPPPYDTRFVDASARSGPPLPVVPGFHGGIPKQWAVAGQDRLGYYVAHYDGEIAAVDGEVGRVVSALDATGLGSRTLVVVTSDHGESLGEHGYFFDHGEDLFEPSLAVPLVVSGPGIPTGVRRDALASTLDVVPTILDAVKVSYPPDLGGVSLLPAIQGRDSAPRDRLFAQNDRNLSATWTARFKTVLTPAEPKATWALYDRSRAGDEERDVTTREPDVLRAERRELELYLERADREWSRTRPLLGEAPKVRLSAEACERLKALNYVVAECRP